MNPFRLSTRLQAPVRGRRAVRLVPGADGAASPAAAPAAARESAVAVPVPWRVVARSPAGVVEVEHRGESALHSVRFALAGAGMLGLSLPRTVFPGERLRVALRGTRGDAAVESPDAMLVLRWFQPDGTELLWPIAL
ncbi:hypothetical protein MUN78_13985 [Leucobacter allii]|uniref:Uncharacterized protein n=1 Tax=Leucobacter allii TaxID=2932247 RepID=A0ABY4FJU4_9MICO|nr:hypothetical protein [Leucobacter allii]UOQ56765.1 hypothetical protein MUN78_13985 [Leucobacter allii]